MPNEFDAAKFRRETVENLPVVEYVKKVKCDSDVKIRESTVAFLRKAYGFSLVATFAIIFCQGFKIFGFNLSETFLHWLGAATVGQIAVLLAMVLRNK